MKKIYLLAALTLAACSNGEQTMLFECEQQNQGEACNKLGKNREGAEALKFFRKGCELENTSSCISLGGAIKGKDRAEALRVFKYACDRGNTDGCVKFAELSAEKK